MDDDAVRAAKAAGRHAAGRLRVALVAACLAFGTAAATAQSALVSATLARPGELLARTSIDAQTVPEPGDFTLQVDAGDPVAATGVTPVPLPPGSTALLLCLDRSGSMGRPAIETMQEVLRRTLVPRQGEPQLPVSVAIVAFGTQSIPLLDLTSDPARVADAIGRLALDRRPEARTMLYDAVAGGLAELRNSQATYKRLLVVSDGNDEGSSLSQKALIERAIVPPSIAVDAVGFGSLAAESSGSLATLAGATGGRFGIARNRGALGDVLAQMIRQFVPRPQYDVRVAYTPAGGGQPPRSAVLWYRPRGGTAVPFPIGADVFAAPPGEDRRSGDAPDGFPGGLASRWAASVRVYLGLPLAVRIGAPVLALLLLAGLGFALLRRRGAGRPPDLPGPPAPPEIDPPFTSGFVPPDAPPGRGRPTLVAHRWPVPGGGRTVAIVEGVSGAAQGQRWRLTTASMRIGAAPDNDLVLRHDEFVSGHHGVLKAEANGLYVIDLGSRNGSEVNGVKFIDATRALAPGDRVTMGRSAFDVLSADARAGAGAGPEPRVG